MKGLVVELSDSGLVACLKTADYLVEFFRDDRDGTIMARGQIGLVGVVNFDAVQYRVRKVMKVRRFQNVAEGAISKCLPVEWLLDEVVACLVDKLADCSV